MAITAGELMDTFAARGFHYGRELIFDYYNALVTKPFVILTGISGAGKSKIARMFADIVSGGDESACAMVPVRPDWRDGKGVFGFHNLIDGSYAATPAVRLFLRALADPEHPYFLILDEMNLAKAEQYFADYLSLLESRREVMAKAPVNTGDIDELRRELVFPAGISLSEAIVLAAIDINQPGTYLPVEDYRENNFVKLWREQFSFATANWTPQFRSELNQPGRVANRMFESPGGGGHSYSLKADAAQTAGDLAALERLREFYANLKKAVTEIHQEQILLHQSPVCLGCTEGAACAHACTFAPSDRYKCPRLYDPATESYLVPPSMPIPLNLFTVGTVNVDETTYMFSPKVLDRANVIEFSQVDFAGLLGLTGDLADLAGKTARASRDDFFFEETAPLPPIAVTLPAPAHAKHFAAAAPEQFADLLRVQNILAGRGRHFGYRVLNEISLFLENTKNNTACADGYRIGLDLQLLQKVFPKLHGSREELWDCLTRILYVCLGGCAETACDERALLAAYAAAAGVPVVGTLAALDPAPGELEPLRYPRSAAKVLDMLHDLDAVGFASFIK